MKVDVLPIGLYQENIYVLHDHDHVLIVDPGAHAREIAKVISKEESVDGILLTHGHEDHTGAVDDVVDMYHCPVYMHMADIPLVDSSSRQRTAYSDPVYSPITPLPEGKTHIGTFDLNVYSTPGHTAGSVCVQYRNLLFSGDTLFAGSCGRTDLFSGDETLMLQSLVFLSTLPNDLIVLPGHGPRTTIKQEKQTNYFMKGM